MIFQFFSFSDDKLGEFLSSTCVNTVSYVTSQELVLSLSLKISYHYTHSYSCRLVDLDYNTCSQVNEYKCCREHTTSVSYVNSGKMCLQNSTSLENYNTGTTLKTKIWISVIKLKFQTCFSFFPHHWQQLGLNSPTFNYYASITHEQKDTVLYYCEK